MLNARAWLAARTRERKAANPVVARRSMFALNTSSSTVNPARNFSP
jgi:hypothetical protein